MVILQAVTLPIAILMQDARPKDPAGSSAITLALVALAVIAAGGLALVVAVTAMSARRASASALRRGASAAARRDSSAAGPVTDAWQESARRMPTPGPGEEGRGPR